LGSQQQHTCLWLVACKASAVQQISAVQLLLVQTQLLLLLLLLLLLVLVQAQRLLQLQGVVLPAANREAP
jgi:hypothetical protein